MHYFKRAAGSAEMKVYTQAEGIGSQEAEK
jgi:hypothetical protein